MNTLQIASVACLAAIAAAQNTPICGVTGVKNQLPYSVSVLKANTTPTGCMSFCKKSSSCKSFAVSNTFCWLFKNAAGVNFKYGESSNYKVWDVGCTISTATSVTTTTSTTTSAGSGSENTTPAEPAPTQDSEPGDSPAISDVGGDGVFPSEDPNFTNTYTYTQFTLPTVSIMGSAPNTVGLPQPTENSRPCAIDPSKTSSHFNLLDSDFMPIVMSGTTGLVPLASPTSEAQANAMGDASKYVLPVYFFEKPADAPDGVYDMVIAGSPPRYVAKLNNGNVVLTTSSTGNKLVTRNGQQMQTTVFRVDCQAAITVVQNGAAFSWDKSGRTTKMTAGTAAKGMVAFPLAVAAKARKARRSIYNQGVQPRCVKAPDSLICKARDGVRAPVKNGCGDANGAKWVPNFTFGGACDKHDLCYDNCEKGTFEQCNTDFLNDMINDGCASKKVWYMWLIYGACVKTAEFYYAVVSSSRGAEAFIQSGKDRCTCTCPGTQNLCGTSAQNAYCTNIFSNEASNCGACGRTCDPSTKCKGGQCVCPIDQCGNQCLSLRDNPNNCGKCGNVCPSDKPACVKGACFKPSPVCEAGFENGDFTSGWEDAWRVSPWNPTTNGQPTYGFNAGYSGDNNGEDEFYISSPRNQGTVSTEFSTTVTACPGVQYRVDFGMFRDQGTDSCTISLNAGGSQVLNYNIPIWSDYPAQRLEQISQRNGVIRAGPFTAGGDVVKNGLSLNVPFEFKLTCNGQFRDDHDAFGMVRFGHFKLTPV
ncbi:hypothetical protein AC579_3021 [Pseudocercospora musae]|uniref:Apple domain-containing protein n=1 Tax=Pseudocercospora musae TaxID=113226 RepID=A0A139HLG1_9PEZI|nr:hypothetical protein AC579_3021 [Pseudocercospora musae]